MAARRKKPTLPTIDPDFDLRMMAAALRIGARNLGHTGVNPAVGCIIVDTSGDTPVVVGRGWTEEGGRPHAEKEALKAAGAAARGATVYVTLEPCAHKGRATSCSQGLIDAGVGRVVGAMADPNPRTNGKGFAMLEAAGIAVTTGVLADDAARAHSGHIARITKGRPHVTLKLAVSADGMIGTRGGERMIITDKPAFEAVQTMRTKFDAVMIGSNTAEIDNPRLNVRLPGLESRSPARVILDSKAELSLGSRLVETARVFPLIVVVGPEATADRKSALSEAGAKIIEVDAGPGGVALEQTLQLLAGEGFSRVLVEGGSEVASSLVSADLLDEVVLFRAPVVVGPDGVRALAGTALSAIERNPRYRVVETAIVGDDQMRRYFRAA
jgi:diaminohydroxyphosphoribosylaminopyrimidine deaminase / 5-amino-6-(5-phosphoribosylamino)uracil reductase